MRDGPPPTLRNEPPAVDPLVGRVIAGKFSVDERLGHGAMGIVYRATQIALERTVAIKVLHRELATDSDFADRFWREAKAASRLDHPNSIRVLDFGQEPDGLLYLAMEYVEGTDLFEWLSRHRPASPSTIVELLSQILAALAVAHDMSVVHRDLKPENVMIVRGKSDDGRAVDVVKVCDFGIAKLLDASSSSSEPRRKHSTTGLIVGTPAYMSPEQARGEKQDARSDLYAVGIILYEFLAGSVPFSGETLIGVAMKHVSEVPERPSARAAGIDPELEAICLKALSKQPADRYQSAREMRQALLGAARKSGFGIDLVSAGSDAPAPALLTRHDSSKPTLTGMVPGTPAPHERRSRTWLALLLTAAVVSAVLVHYRASIFGEGRRVDPVQSAAPVAPVGSLSTTTVEPEPEPMALPSAADDAETLPHRPTAAKRRYGGVNASSNATAPTNSVTLDEPALAATPPTTPPAAAPPTTPPAATADSRALAPVAPTPAPAPAPAPAPPKYDLALARVTIGGARNVVGATAASISRAVSEAGARITACYQAGLPQLGATFEGAGVLHIDTDGAGVISDARLSGPVRGTVSACVAAAVRGHRVANVDTGNASADVPLSFRDH